jgi:hypothetical protein
MIRAIGDLSKSIDFLLENAGAVIQYRLRKEILRDLTQTQEENLLGQIYQTPLFKLLSTYVKPNGYIGSGMHGWDNWRGKVLHRTPLEDGETAARLLSYYAIPKTHPHVAGFVKAMRDEETLRHEFSYIPPEVERYKNRSIGLNNGNCLLGLTLAMQSMLGCGDDDEARHFQGVSLKGFKRVLEISSLGELTKERKQKEDAISHTLMPTNIFPALIRLRRLRIPPRGAARKTSRCLRIRSTTSTRP